MKLVYRSIVFIVTIIFMFVSLVLAFYSFGFSDMNFLPNIIENFYLSWEYGVLFSLIFLAGSSIIYPFFTFDKKFKKTLINSTELGDVNITLGALDNLVKKVVSSREGIADIDTNLKDSESGLEINLDVKINSDYVIPELADELQKVVKSYLEDTTGVKVNKVSLLINEITGREIKESE